MCHSVLTKFSPRPAGSKSETIFSTEEYLQGSSLFWFATKMPLLQENSQGCNAFTDLFSSSYTRCRFLFLLFFLFFFSSSSLSSSVTYKGVLQLLAFVLVIAPAFVSVKDADWYLDGWVKSLKMRAFQHELLDFRINCSPKLKRQCKL